MIETAVALIFAHLLADFVLQTDAMVRNKHRPAVLFGHMIAVTATSWIALGFALAPAPLALVAVSHAAIDAAKLRWGGLGFRGFSLDQAGHLAMIAVAAALFPAAYASGLWASLAAQTAPALAQLPEAMALGAGLIATVWAGGYAVAALMTGVDTPAAASLPRGGRLIGKLERLLILILVLAGEPDGIGFLIAAKSILRFNELAGDADRHVSEYVIIGTLASFACAIGAGVTPRSPRSGRSAPPLERPDDPHYLRETIRIEAIPTMFGIPGKARRDHYPRRRRRRSPG